MELLRQDLTPPLPNYEFWINFDLLRWQSHWSFCLRRIKGVLLMPKPGFGPKKVASWQSSLLELFGVGEFGRTILVHSKRTKIDKAVKVVWLPFDGVSEWTEFGYGVGHTFFRGNEGYSVVAKAENCHVGDPFFELNWGTWLFGSTWNLR